MCSLKILALVPKESQELLTRRTWGSVQSLWLLTTISHHLTISVCTEAALCMCWGRGQAGSGYCDTLSDLHMGCDTSHLPVLDTQVTAPHLIHGRSDSELRDSPECAETQLTSQVRESWQRSVSCSASLNDSQKMHDFIFPCLPMLHGSQPLAGKPCRELLCVSWDNGARIMKFAKLRLEFRCRKEQREDVTEPCWERMVIPSTVLITCFGLPASLCSLGNCAQNVLISRAPLPSFLFSL